MECPGCGCHNEATVRNDQWDFGTKELGILVLPVWSCNVCGIEWTDHEGEVIRQTYVDKIRLYGRLS